MILPRAYGALAAGLVVVAMLGTAYVKGRGDGREAEKGVWAERALQEKTAAVAQARAAWDAEAAERARREARTQEAANEIAEVRIEYLPAKTIVRREVVEKPVYRDCVVEQRMLDLVNAALAGRPDATAFGAGQDGVPTGTQPGG